ncbi:hypothetical protein [Amycolatopsis sp.]|uniref:hypothetical protein n=1 Tax=Amycolatopsis sp. TaxID=37632 RepID=UPI002615E081|nr:hypothetical protein [Amycolatopsis sp.]
MTSHIGALSAGQRKISGHHGLRKPPLKTRLRTVVRLLDAGTISAVVLLPLVPHYYDHQAWSFCLSLIAVLLPVALVFVRHMVVISYCRDASGVTELRRMSTRFYWNSALGVTAIFVTQLFLPNNLKGIDTAFLTIIVLALSRATDVLTIMQNFRKIQSSVPYISLRTIDKRRGITSRELNGRDRKLTHSRR